MDKFELPQEMIDAFKEIARMQNAQMRETVTMLAGFIATNERDFLYMDSYIDRLYDFVEPCTDTEDVLRHYISYIATFDEEVANRRNDDLEDILGYKTKLIYAAGLLAQKLHKGQTAKGGKDYFSSHLLEVAKNGKTGKRK